jgi:hypothetical protein
MSLEPPTVEAGAPQLVYNKLITTEQQDPDAAILCHVRDTWQWVPDMMPGQGGNPPLGFSDLYSVRHDV